MKTILVYLVASLNSGHTQQGRQHSKGLWIVYWEEEIWKTELLWRIIDRNENENKQKNKQLPPFCSDEKDATRYSRNSWRAN